MTLVSNDEQTKIFVGGLSWDTTDEKLRNFFSKFGRVIDACVMKNPTTGRSKGFGFVSFEKAETVQKVLSSDPNELELDGRTIDPKCFDSKNAQKEKHEAKLKEFPKVFLGGLPSNVNETLLKEIFSPYGRVIEVVIMYNQEKKSRGNGFRGFGFLSFENEEPVDKLIALHHIDVLGKSVEIKKAEPRNGKPESLVNPRSVTFTHEHLQSSVPTSSVSAAVQPSSIGSHCWTMPPSNVSATVATPLSVQAGSFVGPFCLPSSVIPPLCLAPSPWPGNPLSTAIAHSPWPSSAVPSNLWPTAPFTGLPSCPSPYFTQIPHTNRVQASNPLLTHSTLASVSLLNSSPTAAALNLTATQEDSTFGPIRFSASNGSLLTAAAAAAAAAASSPSGARVSQVPAFHPYRRVQ